MASLHISLLTADSIIWIDGLCIDLIDHKVKAQSIINMRDEFERQLRVHYMTAQTFVFDDHRLDPAKNLGETINDSAVRLLAALDLHESYSEQFNEITTFPIAENMYGCSPRPLVFVCHDLGGLILKKVGRLLLAFPSIVDLFKALLIGEERSPTHSLVQRTTAIVSFLTSKHLVEAIIIDNC